MAINHQVACIIRSCRERRGYSQEYMADLLDIAQSSYANFESGKTSIHLDRLIRITEVLGIDIREVISLSVKSPDASASLANQLLLPDTKEAYDKLVEELQKEILFLRDLVREKVSE